MSEKLRAFKSSWRFLRPVTPSMGSILAMTRPMGRMPASKLATVSHCFMLPPPPDLDELDDVKLESAPPFESLDESGGEAKLPALSLGTIDDSAMSVSEGWAPPTGVPVTPEAPLK